MEKNCKEENWDLATLINQSNGLIPSTYLKELIEENKKNKLSTDEIINLLKEKYNEKNNR